MTFMNPRASPHRAPLRDWVADLPSGLVALVGLECPRLTDTYCEAACGRFGRSPDASCTSADAPDVRWNLFSSRLPIPCGATMTGTRRAQLGNFSERQHQQGRHR